MDAVPDLEKAKRYLREGAYGCPFCDDKDGDRFYDRDYVDGDLRAESCHCTVCGNSWTEVYWLAYIHEARQSEVEWEVRKEWAEEEEVEEFTEGKVVYG